MHTCIAGWSIEESGKLTFSSVTAEVDKSGS